MRTKANRPVRIEPWEDNLRRLKDAGTCEEEIAKCKAWYDEITAPWREKGEQLELTYGELVESIKGEVEI